jgi:hypothetical protein
MRVRTVIAGISAGLICLAALTFQYHRIEPQKFVPDWPFAAGAASLPGWVSVAILSFCGITLFTFGWIAARWNWADSRGKSLQVGASAGLLAGCLIFDFIGAFWFSVKGMSEILRNAYRPVSEDVGTRLLIEGMVQTGVLLYVNFALILVAGVVLGGLGGLTSAILDRKDFWGSDPRSPEGWLLRLPAYLLTFFGVLNAVVTIAVLNVLMPRILNTVMQLEGQGEIQLRLNLSVQLVELSSNLTVWIFTFLPLGMTWGWILRVSLRRKRLAASSAFWILLSLLVYLALFWFVSPGVLSSLLHISFLVLALLMGVFLGFITEERAQGFPYRFSDWVGYGLSYGILAGTQIVAGILSYGLALNLIAIQNIPHLLSRGPVEHTPVEQLGTLFNLQSTSAIFAILGSLVIGLIIAGIVSFFRTIFGVKDAASAWE